MPRSVSNTFRSAIYAQETGEAFLALITIDHPSFPVPIRVTSDAVDTASRGETFVAYPFKLTLPTDIERQAPMAKLSIDNVHRDILRQLRSTPDAATVTIEMVLGSDPDTVEATFPDFRLAEIGHDFLTIEGTLTVERFAAEPFPSGVFGPAEFPGMF